MADVQSLNEHFVVPGRDELPHDVTIELDSVMRLHGLSAQELFFKWESYCIKMGSENTRLDYDTARAFKKDIQEGLERETRSRGARAPDRKVAHGTPKTGGDEMLDMIGVKTAPRLEGSTVKRKAPYDVSIPTKVNRAHRGSSPTDGRATDLPTVASNVAPFSQRTNAGQIIETLNDHLTPYNPPLAPHAEPRVKLVANTEIKKFGYKPLAMHLTEASEILDERIDSFRSLVQGHHGLDDTAFGNAASTSTSDVVAVGRIASDNPDGKPNSESLLLETSRQTGAGVRVPVKFAKGCTGDFFPGQIVALRGKNASGDYFLASEILEVPFLHPAASSALSIEAVNERLGLLSSDEAGAGHATNVMISSGPYTADDNLNFEPLHVLCDKAQDSVADVLILVGPFLDLEHPLVACGDFEFPEDAGVEPDQATLTDAFRLLISEPLTRLARSVPSITIVMVPSVRDATHKHMAWPQSNLSRNELGLPKQARTVSNPVTISLNETMVAISAADILWDLRSHEVGIPNGKSGDLLLRLPRHVIQQRHFFPMFPPVERSQLPKAGTAAGLATGTPMDVSYLKLAEWQKVQPDILVLPSALPPFAKVVEGVVVINPGPLSKRRGPGTYSQVALHPRRLSTDELKVPGSLVSHNVYERARVDVFRI